MINKYQIKNFTTQNGVSIDIELGYTMQGNLNKSKTNAILVLTSHAATHVDAQDLFAKTEILKQSDHCVVVINMFSNSVSSSPSNTPKPYNGNNFPLFTIFDNVAAQYKLIKEELGINKLNLVMGFSMGGLQAFEWGAQHPEMVESILPICGAAKVSRHNWLFLEGIKSALLSDSNFNGGDYKSQPKKGLDAFSTVYAGWAFSQDFFREELFKEMGMEKIEDIIEFLKNYMKRRDANDLLGMLETWQAADISNNYKYKGNFDKALQSIESKAIIMPCSTDLYFRVADSEYEVSQMPNAELRIINSKYGHVAGSGMDLIGKYEIDRAITDLLNN